MSDVLSILGSLSTAFQTRDLSLLSLEPLINQHINALETLKGDISQGGYLVEMKSHASKLADTDLPGFSLLGLPDPRNLTPGNVDKANQEGVMNQVSSHKNALKSKYIFLCSYCSLCSLFLPLFSYPINCHCSPVLSVLSVLSVLPFSQFSRPLCSLCSHCSPVLSVLPFSQFSRPLSSPVLSVLPSSQFFCLLQRSLLDSLYPCPF